jgi:protein TonB
LCPKAPTFSSTFPLVAGNLLRAMVRRGLPGSVFAIALLGSICLHLGVAMASSYLAPAQDVPEPLPPVELEVYIPPAVPEPVVEPEPEPEPIEPPPAIEPPKPKLKVVEKPKPPEEEPPQLDKAKPDKVAAEAVPPSAVAAGPTVASDQAMPGACEQGVCLPTGPGGGIGKVGSGGTARTGAPEVVTAARTAPPPTSLGRPLTRVRPAYPARAAEHNIEGWVLLRFKVGRNGEVLEPEVVEASPARIFNTAAVEAIKLWRYKPMLVAGVPTVREGVLVRLSFKLD